jgi:hypothetical protein
VFLVVGLELHQHVPARPLAHELRGPHSRSTFFGSISAKAPDVTRDGACVQSIGGHCEFAVATTTPLMDIPHHWAAILGAHGKGIA